jgi:hypothetical protein
MKSFLILILLFTVMAITSFKPNDEGPDRKTLESSNIKYSDNPPGFVDSKYMDVNAISAIYKTNASFNRVNIDQPAFEWPKGSGNHARYINGIWLGCVSGEDTLMAVADYSYDYSSGYIDDSGNVQADSTYRIYKITKNEINSYDYLHWPGNQGAYLTPEGKPYVIGDQEMFYVYTDYPHVSNNASERNLNVQILQTNWAYNPYELSSEYPANPFNNTIFMEYRIINRSNETWNNMWMGFFENGSLGRSTDDKLGCDTNLNFSYLYNGTNNDGVYGAAPPAVGNLFLRGSYKYTGNLNDTIKYYQPFGSNNIKMKVGYKDEGFTVNNFFNGGSPQPSDPGDYVETYRVLKGLWRSGQRWISPSGDTTTIVYSGDPVTGSGWNMPWQGEMRYVTSTGPFNNIDPGDTIVVVFAQIIAKGTSNLNSITQLRNTAKVITNFYNNNLAPQTKAPAPSVSSYAPGNGKITLTWNDTTQSQSFKNILSGGTYNFQGYNIYQIRSYSSQPSASDTILLKTFDIVDGIKNISDSSYIPPHPGIFFGIVQYGSDNGISKYLEIDKDTLLNKEFVNGTEYKFAVTSYYYDPTGGLYTFPKVLESPKSNIIKVIPQNLTSGTQISYNLGDTIYTDQKDLAVMPVIFDPLKLINANYTSTFGGTYANPNWTLTRNINGSVTTLFENVYNFTGQQESVKTADGIMFNHSLLRDSGVIHDPLNLNSDPYNSLNRNTRQGAWTYEPEGKEWFTAPDTNEIYSISNKDLYTRLIRNQFQSRSLGMSFPNTRSFRNIATYIKATAQYFEPALNYDPLLYGGPLRKIKIVFGNTQKAYRYRPALGNTLLSDTNLLQTPYADMVDIPFSVFTADELDSTGGVPRQLNVAFIDTDDNGLWDPDTTGMSKFQFTYILASTYDSLPNKVYPTKNPGISGTDIGFSRIDIMYAWLPRVKNNNGVPANWNAGDVLTVTPYRITRPDFVPGYPVKYSWEVKGTEIGNQQIASSEINSINVFPNPYYGISELEYNDTGEKFIYFSHLPQVCTILIYSLDGSLVNKIERTSSSPDKSLEKWNLKNQGGSYVASGMYIAVVDCKELGAKTLKFAVFTR